MKARPAYLFKLTLISQHIKISAPTYDRIKTIKYIFDCGYAPVVVYSKIFFSFLKTTLQIFYKTIFY